MGLPDPMRARYREQLGEAVRQVVFFGARIGKAMKGLSIPVGDASHFKAMLRSELQGLEEYNCARYRLPFGKTQEWIDKGRPQ